MPLSEFLEIPTFFDVVDIISVEGIMTFEDIDISNVGRGLGEEPLIMVQLP